MKHPENNKDTPTDFHSTTVQTPTNFHSTAVQTPTNFHSTTVQTPTNFHSTTVQTPTNFYSNYCADSNGRSRHAQIFASAQVGRGSDFGGVEGGAGGGEGGAVSSRDVTLAVLRRQKSHLEQRLQGVSAPAPGDVKRY